MRSLLIGLVLTAGCADRALQPTETTADLAFAQDAGTSNDMALSCAGLTALPDADFYALFLWQYPVFESWAPDEPLFLAAFNSPSTRLPGTNTAVAVQINLFSDGTYRASYNELTCFDPDYCGTNNPSVTSGNGWRVTDGKILLDDFGTGTRDVAHEVDGSCTPTIDFTYAHDIISPGLAGLVDTLYAQDAATSDEGLF